MDNKLINKFLEGNTKTFRSLFSVSPIKSSEIQAQFYDFLDKNLLTFKLFFSSQLQEKNTEFSGIQIENLYKTHLLDNFLQENLQRIYQEILRNIKDFMNIFDFEKELNFDFLLEFLKNLDLSFSLKTLNLQKDLFMKSSENMMNLKEIVKLEKNNKDDRTFLEIIQKMSDNMAHLFLFFLKYFEKVLEIFEYEKDFIRLYVKIYDKIGKFLNKQFEEKEPFLYKKFNEFLNKITEKTCVNLDEILNNLQENNPKLVVSSLKEYRNNCFMLIKEFSQKELGFIPSNLLIYSQIKQIRQKINEKFHEKLDEFHKNQEESIKKLETKFCEFFNEFLTKKKGLFNRFSNEKKDLLLIIIISSIFVENSSENEYLDNKSYIDRLKKGYFSENNSENLDNLLNLIKDLETTEENHFKILEIKERSLYRWSTTIEEDLNLFAIFSIVMEVQQIHPSNQFLDKKQIVDLDAFSTNSHKKIQLILRNLNDFTYGYNNFQLLGLIEHMISKMLFPLENWELLKLKIPNNAFYNDILQNFSLKSAHSKGNEEFIRDIRVINIDLLQKKTKFLLKRIEDLQIKKDFIEPPSYFEFEKISKIESRSRIINICISGFLSQDSNKRKEWADLIDICDRNNAELLTLKWLSSSQEELLNFFSESYANMKSFSAINSYLPLVGAIKLIMENPFNKSFEEAKKTGFYLAHLLGELEIFGNNNVNLIGFSMGTIVIYECLLELQRMRKFNIIHDILIMGGIISRNDLNQMKLDMISGRFMHCFSKNDLALKILFRIAKFGEQAVGVKRIEECADKKFISLDCTEIVNGHMDYRKKMKEILKRIDFGQDACYLEKEVVESEFEIGKI